MKNLIKRIPLLLLLILLIVISCTDKTLDKEVETNNINEQKEEVKAVLTAMWNAIENEDIDKYAEYIHPDYTQFGETDSVLSIGKDTEVNGVRSWVLGSDSIHTEMIDPEVTIRGNVAWITYIWFDKGITNGKSFTSKGKSTRIFVKEDGKWLCMHGHYTYLPE